MTGDGASDRGREPPAGCCDASRIAEHFDGWAQDRVAAGADVLAPVSERLRAALVAQGPAGARVVEIGCGTGGLLLALAEAGAARVTGVDLSEVGVATARTKLAAQGFGERADFVVGDGANASLDAHDWVVLDRVLCCYAGADALVERALAVASGLIAFSVPASAGLRGLAARLRFGVEDRWDRWRGQGTPMYVHDVRHLERPILAAGFRRSHVQALGLWWLGVYRR